MWELKNFRVLFTSEGRRKGEMDTHIVSSNLDVVPSCCGERDEHESKAASLPVDLHSSPLAVSCGCQITGGRNELPR